MPSRGFSFPLFLLVFFLTLLSILLTVWMVFFNR
jgi:hypothetical protein